MCKDTSVIDTVCFSSDPTEIGTLIRKHRLNKKISQKTFASLLDCNVKTIQRWESGVCRPSDDNCIIIEHILGIKITVDRIWSKPYKRGI